MKCRLLLCLLLFPGFVFAQKEIGTIEGTVRDNEGRPIPGATLIASSPSLIGGATTTYSGEDGFYRFPVLAPGIYEVQSELSGFRTVTQPDVRVFAGKGLTVDFQLELETVNATIEVSGKPPLIDRTTTAVTVTVPPEIIANLPKQNLQDLFSLTPGVGDDLVAYGADGPKAINPMIDGVSVGSPHGVGASVRSAVFIDYDYNWIDQFQVTGIGAPAEFGRFTGVAGNFTTRSGGNQFHGLFETFFQNQNLTSTNVPNPEPEIPFKSFDISAQVGGPILRDKLWFFSGIQHPHNEDYRPSYDVSTNIETKVITKLTYKWNDNNNLQGLWNSNVAFEEPGATPNVLPEARSKFKTVQSSWNVTWISLFAPQTNFEGRFGGFHNHSFEENDHPDLPGHYDLVTEIFSVNSPAGWDGSESRVQANGALSHYAADFLLGSHDFRFGIQFEQSDAFWVDYQFHGGFLYNDLGGEPFLRYIRSGRNWDGTNESTSIYAQDEWNVTDNINLSLGVRWDRNRGTTDRGVVFSTDPVAPRLGFVWTLDKQSETVIKAHYGDYYEALLNRFYSFLTEQYGTQFRERFNSATGEWERDGEGFYEYYIGDNKFKQPMMRQFTLGVDRVLPGEIPLGVHYIYRRYGNIVEDVSISDFDPLPFVNPLTGETITVYNRVNFNKEYFVSTHPELYRRYDGVQFTSSKYLFRNLSVMGSFVYSKLRGNYPGDNSANANTPFLDTPNSLINFPGRLTNDPTIAWKIAGTYSLPLGFNTGFFLRHESGDTWAATANPRLPCCPTLRIFVEPAGSQRLPSQTLLDLRVEKQFPFFGGQLRFAVDVFNVFNSAYVISVENRVEVPNFGKDDAFTEPRELRLGIRYTF